MGFFSIFKKKQEIKEEWLSVDRTGDILREDIKRINENSRYSKLSEPLLAHYSAIKNALRELETAEKEEKIDPRLETSASNMRNYFVKIMRPCVDIDVGRAITLEQLNSIVKKSEKVFEASKVVSTDKASIVDAVYSREMHRLGSSIKKLALEIDSIKSKIKDDGLKIEKIQSAINELDGLKILMIELKQTREKREHTEESLKTMQENLQKLRLTRDSIMAKEEYIELNAVTAELEGDERELCLLEKKAEENVFLTSRILKKYFHANPADASAINQLISNPQVLYKSGTMQMLDSVKKFAEKIPEDAKKINALVSDSSGKQYFALKSRIETLKKKLGASQVLSEKNATEKTIEDIAQNIKFLMQDLKNAEEQERKIQALIDAQKLKTQAFLEKELERKILLETV